MAQLITLRDNQGPTILFLRDGKVVEQNRQHPQLRGADVLGTPTVGECLRVQTEQGIVQTAQVIEIEETPFWKTPSSLASPAPSSPETACSRCTRIKPSFLMRLAPNGDKVCPVCITDGRGEDCKDAPRLAQSATRIYDGVTYA